MNNILNNVRTGIYNLLNGSTNDFKTAVNSQLYYSEAPTTAPSPYAVFDITSNVPTHDTVNEFNDVLIQFTVCDTNLVNAEGIITKLATQFEGGVLTVPNYAVIRIRRINIINLGKENNVWNIVLRYRLEIQN